MTKAPLPWTALAAFVLLAGCNPPPRGTPSQVAQLQQELDATEQYEVLLKRLLTDSSPMIVESALLCESRHLLHELGPDRLEEALNAAEARAYVASDRPRREAVNLLLANKTYEASDSICRQLGREGYLKDTSWITGSR